MKEFIGKVGTMYHGSDVEFSFWTEDNATDDEIEAAARAAMFDELEWSYEEAKPEDAESDED